MHDKLLSPEEAAKRISVTPNTIRAWLRDGSLKGIKLGKKIWRIEESELNEYMCREQGIDYGIKQDAESFTSAENRSGINSDGVAANKLQAGSNYGFVEKHLDDNFKKALSQLSFHNKLKLYELAAELAEEEKLSAGAPEIDNKTNQRIQELLKGCIGALSDDISAEREEHL